MTLKKIRELFKSSLAMGIVVLVVAVAAAVAAAYFAYLHPGIVCAVWAASTVLGYGMGVVVFLQKTGKK